MMIDHDSSLWALIEPAPSPHGTPAQAPYESYEAVAWPSSAPSSSSSGGGCGWQPDPVSTPSSSGGSAVMAGEGVEATVKVDRWLLLGLAALLAVYLWFTEGS